MFDNISVWTTVIADRMLYDIAWEYRFFMSTCALSCISL